MEGHNDVQCFSLYVADVTTKHLLRRDAHLSCVGLQRFDCNSSSMLLLFFRFMYFQIESSSFSKSRWCSTLLQVSKDGGRMV